jgi:hypothetical protein
MGDLSNVLGGLGKALGGAAFPGTYANKALMGPMGMGMGLLGQFLGGDSSGGANPEEVLNPGQKMFGMEQALPAAGAGALGNVDPRVIIDESGAMGKGGDGAEQIVTGDGWKPRKPTVLGAIADAFLMSRGGKPMFSMMRDRRSINEAMGGFTQDPEQAINRLSRIPGQEDAAWKMYGQHRDDQRGDLAADSLRDTREEKYLSRVGGMLNRVTSAKDPSAAYKSLLPTLRRYAESRGMDLSDLPEEYDQDTVMNWVMGNVSPEDQLKMEALQQHRSSQLDLNERKLQSQDSYRQERLQDFDAQEAGRNERHNTPRPRAVTANPTSRLVRDANGNVLGKTDKTGKVARLVAPDGGFQFFEVLPNGGLGKRLPNKLFEKEAK